MAFEPAKPWEITAGAGALLILFPLGGFAALSIIGSAWFGPFIYPLPLATAIPFLLLGNASFLSWLVPSLFFWLSGIHLFRGVSQVPLRSQVLFWALVVLTLVYFAFSWEYALRWQGYLHLIGVAVLNLIAIAALSALLVSAKAKPSFSRNVAFHWMLVAWLAWFAFPWLGEGL